MGELDLKNVSGGNGEEEKISWEEYLKELNKSYDKKREGNKKNKK